MSESDLKSEMEILSFYERRLARKLMSMHRCTQRAAFMADLFGRRWQEIYDRLCMIYPSLMDTQVDEEGP